MRLDRDEEESEHVIELLSMQFLQVDDVISILSPTVVLVGEVLKDSIGGTMM